MKSKGINLLPDHILGLCDPKTKTILINEKDNGLSLPRGELSRLTDLGEKCIRIAQTVSRENLSREVRAFGERLIGREILHSSGYSDLHAFAGVVGGLEIYGTQMFDGLRAAWVRNKDEEVFGYMCEGLGQNNHPENPKILTYVPGDWEEKITKWYEGIKARFSQRVLTSPFW